MKVDYCLCGCKKKIDNPDKWGRYRKYIWGHIINETYHTKKIKKLPIIKCMNENCNQLMYKNNNNHYRPQFCFECREVGNVSQSRRLWKYQDEIRL